MDFIIDNYIWFIVGALVIIMAVIGYFADKTNFGRKEIQKRVKKVEEKPKKEKKAKKNKKDKKAVDNTPVAEVDETPVEIPDPDFVGVDLYAPVSDNSSAVNEDLYAPLENSAASEPVETIEDLYEKNEPQEDLYAPLTDSVSPEEVEVSTWTDKPKEVVKEEEPEEDIWQF